jgi:hypothetical protein
MPWGADMAFMQAPFFVPFGQSQVASVYSQSMLANRLFQDKQVAERYRETMRWQLANVWKEEELIKSIDRLEALLKPHLHARQSGAPGAMKTVRSFVKGRRAKIEKELDKWPVKVAAEPRKPMYHAEIGAVKGSFSTKFAERPPQVLAESGVVKLELQLREKPVALKKAGATVHPPVRGGFLFGFGGPPPESPSAIHLVISGVRDPDGRPISITLPLDTNVLVASLGKPMEVQGSFSGADGNGGGFMGGGSTVTGKLTLTKAGAKVDHEFEGAFELKIFEVHGGFFDQRPQAPPSRNANN